MPAYPSGTVVVPTEVVMEGASACSDMSSLVKLTCSVVEARAEILAVPAVASLRCHDTRSDPINVTIGIGSLVLRTKNNRLLATFKGRFCETATTVWLDTFRLRDGSCVFICGLDARGAECHLDGNHVVATPAPFGDLNRVRNLVGELGCASVTVLEIVDVGVSASGAGKPLNGSAAKPEGVPKARSRIYTLDPSDLALNWITGRQISVEVPNIPLDRTRSSSEVRVIAWTEEGTPLVMERDLEGGVKHVIINPALLSTGLGHGALFLLLLRTLYDRQRGL